MYSASRFSAAGIRSHAEAIVGGMGFVLGYMLADLATAEHSHA